MFGQVATLQAARPEWRSKREWLFGRWVSPGVDSSGYTAAVVNPEPAEICCTCSQVWILFGDL